MKSRQPLAYARLLADRNRAWMPKLEKILASESTQLIIVGAAHTSGPDGLLSLLKAKGYDIHAVAGDANTKPVLTRGSNGPWLMPTLNVRDPDGAYAFYQKAFGLEAGAQLRDDKNRISRGELKYHDSTIILVPEDARRPSPLTAKSSAPSALILYVDNVDAAVARAKKAGAEIVEAPADQGWGERTALLRDADGYLWQLSATLQAKMAAVKATP